MNELRFKSCTVLAPLSAQEQGAMNPLSFESCTVMAPLSAQEQGAMNPLRTKKFD
jgi:hypothetical protein